MRGNRRDILTIGGALSALSVFPASAALAGDYKPIPQKPSVRVIVDNDMAGDPDGLVALAHQLLSPKSVVPLITVTPINAQFAAMDGKDASLSAEAGADLTREMLTQMAYGGTPKVVAGQGVLGAGLPNAAAEAIVAEAMRDDPMPLFLTCGGPLTNVAAALRLEPKIGEKMTLIWIGGGGYPDGGWEYNWATDAEAADTVFAQSQVPIWQIPQPAYRQVQISIAELGADMRPISPFTQWLYDRFTSPPDFVDLGGTWPQGDSPLVLLTAVSGESSVFVEQAPRLFLPDGTYGDAIAGRTIRVYTHIDVRLLWADFMAKLRMHATGG